MYLDTQERKEAHQLILRFAIAWFFYHLHRISNAHRIKQMILLFGFCSVMVTLTLTLPDTLQWAWWVGFTIFTTVLWGSHLQYCRHQEKELPRDAFENWCAEIDQLETDSEERQLFLQLLAAMRNNEREEGIRLATEAAHSTTLSRLSFIRALHALIPHLQP